MGNSEKLLVAGTKPAGDVVGINLTLAAHLAAALDRTALDLTAAGADLRAAALVAGTVVPAVAGVATVGGWARAEARALVGLVDRLAHLDDPRIRPGATDPAFADPTVGHARAGHIVAALAAGDLTRARRLLEASADDPVVATVLVGRLGSRGVVDLLAPAAARWGADDGDAADLRALVDLVGRALASALRHGTSTVSLGDLAARADGRGIGVAPVALLLAGSARFPAAALADAVATVVLPLNRATATAPGTVPWRLPDRRRALDARVVVLSAVGRDRRAAVAAVAAADLGDLLPGAVGYTDRGAALAEVLREATTPLGRHGVPVGEPLSTGDGVRAGAAGGNARRVIEWIGAHRDVPPLVHADLGRLARPWIGSFRSAGLDAAVRRPVDLDEALARAFLTYAQSRDDVAEGLADAAWTWAGREVDGLVHRRGVVGFDAVGSVLGLVTVAALDADARRAADQDRRIHRQNRLWRRVAGLASSRLPGPVRTVTGPAVRRGLDAVLDDADRELAHWRDLRDETVAHEYLALDHLIASRAWARHADELPPPPAGLLLDPQDPAAGLRHPLTLGEDGVTAWTAWRSSWAGSGRPVRQLAGDQFLAETRE